MNHDKSIFNLPILETSKALKIRPKLNYKVKCFLLDSRTRIRIRASQDEVRQRLGLDLDPPHRVHLRRSHRSPLAALHHAGTARHRYISL
jgi:hypothetical protein